MTALLISQGFTLLALVGLIIQVKRLQRRVDRLTYRADSKFLRDLEDGPRFVTVR